VFLPDNKTKGSFNVKTVEELIQRCKKWNLKGLSCLSVNPTLTDKTKTDSITDIENILFDIDVKKERKINGVSTPADKKIAFETTRKIKKKLEEKINLRISLVADSGNGYHIYIPIYINLDGFFTGKNEDENKELWDNSDNKKRITYLEEQLKKFNNNVCVIDCISKDIIRRVKIPGTWNVKEDINEEDYRLAKITETHKEVLSKIWIESNTKIFNGIEIKKEEPSIISTVTEVQDFEEILKKDDKLRDLYNGDWEKEPYCLNEDGTKKTKWTRSEAEHTILCKLVWYELPEEQIFQIMDGCKIGKWQQRPDSTKNLSIKSAIKWNNEHGGTKSANRQIPVMNGKKQIAMLHILGYNKYKIVNGDETVIPTTQGEKKVWYMNRWSRDKIVKDFVSFFSLPDYQAEKIVNNLCSQAAIKIKQLSNEGAFKGSLDDELEEILNSIYKTLCIPSEDGNIYNIHLDNEVISLTDIDIYEGSRKFCIQYLNRFHKHITIGLKTWTEEFLAKILSHDLLEMGEEKIDTDTDLVFKKFMQKIKGTNLYNWSNIEKRKEHQNIIFLDTEINIVMVSSSFIEKFFEMQRISITYKIKPNQLNSYLRDKKRSFLVDKRTTQRVGNSRENFWRFDAEKLELTEENIIKDNETQDIGSKNLESFEKTDESEDKTQEVMT